MDVLNWSLQTMFDTLHVLNALRKIPTSLDFVLMHYDELNMVGPVGNKCNALRYGCRPLLTVLYWVVLEMYCNSPNLFINKSINQTRRNLFGSFLWKLNISSVREWRMFLNVLNRFIWYSNNIMFDWFNEFINRLENHCISIQNC